jgi:hypothetical protein
VINHRLIDRQAPRNLVTEAIAVKVSEKVLA